MAIIARHIETNAPFYGLPSNALNAPAQYVNFAKASASNAVHTTANFVTGTSNLYNTSFAPGTNVDVARNALAYLAPNTGSAGLYSAGTLVAFGKDIYGYTRSESFAVTALNSVSDPTKGVVNFASLDSLSVSGLIFHTASSSARSAVSMLWGVGQKLGLPVSLISSDGVFDVHFGTTPLLTSSGASSTNNQYVVVTGDYTVNGLSNTAAYASGSLLQVGYMHLGYRAPFASMQ